MDKSAVVGSAPTEEIQKLMNDGHMSSSIKDGHVHYECHICDKKMSGNVPTMDHIKCNKHIKNCKYVWAFRFYILGCRLFHTIQKMF